MDAGPYRPTGERSSRLDPASGHPADTNEGRAIAFERLGQRILVAQARRRCRRQIGHAEALNDCLWAQFTLPSWQEKFETAKSEATGNLRKLQLALDNVVSVAVKAAKSLADKKLKDDAKLAETIKDAANELAGRMHANRILPLLTVNHNETFAKYDDIVRASGKTMQQTVGKVAAAMLKIQQASYQPEVFNKNVVVVREIAQCLGNIKNYLAKGWKLNIDAHQADFLFLEMKDWRNGKPQFDLKTDPQIVAREVYQIRDAMRRSLLAWK